MDYIVYLNHSKSKDLFSLVTPKDFKRRKYLDGIKVKENGTFIWGRGQTFPSIEKTPSVTINLIPFV